MNNLNSHVPSDNIDKAHAVERNLLIKQLTKSKSKCVDIKPEVNFLLEQGTLNEVLTYAIRLDRLEIVKYIVKDLKVDIHVNDDQAIQDACYYGHLEMAKYLVEQGSVKEKTLQDIISFYEKGIPYNFRIKEYLEDIIRIKKNNN